MKKLLISTLAVASLFAANTDTAKEIEALKAKLQKLEKQVEKNKKLALNATKKVNPISANDHLYWSFDLRSTGDYIYEKTKSGIGFTTVTPNADGTVTFSNPSNISSQKYYNNILTNRVILTGVAKPSDNLKATLKIEANNIFGMNSETQMSPYNNIAWVANETPDDTNIRVKEAFFNYHFGEDNEYMFSAGRRPATNGYPANLREGDSPSSPLAHLINMEFDGFSFKIGNAALPETFEDYGTWLKFCAGRGYSSSNGKWPANGSPAYSKDNLGITDFAGFILVPYDDGQYALWTETVFAWNMKGYNVVSYTDADNDGNPESVTLQMDDLGNYFGFNAVLKADGIGDGISDFLDDTKAFISFAMSQTKPFKDKQMLGATDNRFGKSIWVGADMPGIGDSDRFGFNIVAGSKYWRSMTYGEDTLVGSIAAVRGKAFDIYYHKQIIPHLTAGLRATLINYDYAGSDAFFGMGGNPNNPVYVEKAEDIRAYIRYNF